MQSWSLFKQSFDFTWNSYFKLPTPIFACPTSVPVPPNSYFVVSKLNFALQSGTSEFEVREYI